MPWWVLGGVACGGMLGGGAGQSVGGYSTRVEPAVPIMGVMSRVVILVAAGSTQCACVVSEGCECVVCGVCASEWGCTCVCNGRSEEVGEEEAEEAGGAGHSMRRVGGEQ